MLSFAKNSYMHNTERISLIMHIVIQLANPLQKANYPLFRVIVENIDK